MKRVQFSLKSLVVAGLVVESLGICSMAGAVLNAEDRIAVSAVKSARRAASQILGARLSADGLLTGRLNLTDSISGSHVAAESLTVKFIQRGSIIAQAKPGPGGIFQADGLTPGVFSVIASGADGFYASTLVIYPHLDVADATATRGSTGPLQIDATVVSPANVKVVHKLLADSNAPSTNNKPARQRQVTPASLESDAAEDVATPPVPLQTPVITIGSNGRGEVKVNKVDPATGQRSGTASASMYFIQRGVVRGQFQTDQDGTFNAKGLVPGQYSLLIIANESKSFAAIGVLVETAAASSGTVNKSSRLGVLPAKLRQNQAPTVDTMPNTDMQNQPGDPNNNQPVGGAMVGGGTGGGGGGFGGGGGGALGAIGLGAGIAGLATGIAALSRNNNNAASP